MFSFAHGGNIAARRLPMRAQGLAGMGVMGSASVRAPGEGAHVQSYSEPVQGELQRCQ